MCNVCNASDAIEASRQGGIKVFTWPSSGDAQLQVQVLDPETAEPEFTPTRYRIRRRDDEDWIEYTTQDLAGDLGYLGTDVKWPRVALSIQNWLRFAEGSAPPQTHKEREAEYERRVQAECAEFLNALERCWITEARAAWCEPRVDYAKRLKWGDTLYLGWCLTWRIQIRTQSGKFQSRTLHVMQRNVFFDGRRYPLRDPHEVLPFLRVHRALR